MHGLEPGAFAADERAEGLESEVPVELELASGGGDDAGVNAACRRLTGDEPTVERSDALSQTIDRANKGRH